MKWKMIIALVGSLLISGVLFAKPPKDICDPLKGTTPGLYGLCVAFCGSHPPGDLGTLELSTTQLNLLQAYNRKRTDDDPAMPCFKGCPCFTTDEAEFVAMHPDFYRCYDFFDEESGERDQQIEVWGTINLNGQAQTSADVSASLFLPEPGLIFVSCQWNYNEDSSSIHIGREWEGHNFDADNQRKYEDCQAIIGHVSEEYQLPCETKPECEIRILVEPYTRDDLFIEINGSLINDPRENCVNNAPIARVDWYWGDGAMDTFEMMPDGYVYPFPNSHTYSQNSFYVWSIYAYDEDGKIIDRASGLLILW
jgi:hypothetical protein